MEATDWEEDQRVGEPAQEFSISEVKHIIKEDFEVKSISTEACFVITKALEKLVQDVALKAAAKLYDTQREVLEYNDLAEIISNCNALDFLDDVVPCKIPVIEVVARMKADT